MRSLAFRAAGVALLTLITVLSASGASVAAPSRPGAIESLTLKEMISRLDTVEYDLRYLETNVEQIRRDVEAKLARSAWVRVLDAGVVLDRSKTTLDRSPRLIGAMQREGRWDSYQRSRQEELSTRQAELVGKWGKLNRVVQALEQDVGAQLGVDLKGMRAWLDYLQQLRDAATDPAVKAEIDRLIKQAEAGIQSGNLNTILDVMKTVSQRLPEWQKLDAATNSIPPPDAPIPVGPTSGPGAGGFDTSTGGPGAGGFARGGPGAGPGAGGVDGIGGPGAGMGPGAGAGAGGPGGYGPGAGAGAGGVGAGAGMPGGGVGGALPPGVTQAPGGGYLVTMPDGTERYFPADLTKGGVGTRYLGEKGTRLIEEVKEYLDLSPGAAGGQYQIRQGESIRWGFAIVPVGQTQDPSGGVRSSFKLTDRTGQGSFKVTGWRISGPGGNQLAAGPGEEAAAVVTQSGNYRVEFSGTTDWGSAFRIEINQPIAVQ